MIRGEGKVQITDSEPRVAEFFAGIGLVRSGLEAEGFKVVFSNDIDRTKKAIYESNHGLGAFVLSDIRNLTGANIPNVEVAVASFPCTDVSLAGNRAGLEGSESSLIREFQRILNEMGARKPNLVVLENVPGFATSNSGHDLRLTIEGINRLGYICDILVLDALRFVPQSRPRIFLVCWLGDAKNNRRYFASEIRPPWITRFAERNPQLSLHPLDLPPLPNRSNQLGDLIERIESSDPIWWDGERLARFLTSLSTIQEERLARLKASFTPRWATAYRRTRNGKAVWEIRRDDVSGCLRTGKGGSSRQAVVQAGRGEVRVRWMTGREYCRLQGAPWLDLTGVSDNQARFALGDAVCVPVIRWLAKHCLKPLILSDAASNFDHASDSRVSHA